MGHIRNEAAPIPADCSNAVAVDSVKGFPLSEGPVSIWADPFARACLKADKEGIVPASACAVSTLLLGIENV